jgi:hypothetical protein
MAGLVCPCARGGDLWGEFWWVDGEYKWVFFDDDNTSETYTEQVTHCFGCGKTPRSEDPQGNIRFRAPRIAEGIADVLFGSSAGRRIYWD